MGKRLTMEKLKGIIGEESVRKLIEEVAGTFFYVPKKSIDFPDQETKEKYIKNLYFDSALSVKEIAEKVNLSVDRIRKIICKKQN